MILAKGEFKNVNSRITRVLFDNDFCKWYNKYMDSSSSLLAKNLIYLRKSKDLTQSQLAQELNYSDKTVSKWENDDAVPDIKTLIAISEFFGVSLDDLCKTDLSTYKPKEVLQPKIRRFTKNKKIITSLSVLLVWFLATLAFVIVRMACGLLIWQTFIWALPITFIVLLVFSCIWGRKGFILTCITALIWTLLAAIFIQLLPLKIQNLWLIFVLGIPMQACVIAWSFFKFVKSKDK